MSPFASSLQAFSTAVIASWVRGWLISGCALESLLLLAGPTEHFDVSRVVLLAALNAGYLLASTSWLFRLVFALLCWPLIPVTCIAQYAPVSNFTRARLRPLLKLVHFYRDRIAFFDLPSLVIDQDVDGLLTVRGITFSLLDLTLELHGIEVGLDMGSGHELSIHSDSITIKLFRQINIDEVYGVHFFTRGDADRSPREDRADSRTDSHDDGTHDPLSKKDAIKERFHPSVEESPKASKRDFVKDRVLPKSRDEPREEKSEPTISSTTVKTRLPSRADVEAEDRYDEILHGLRTSNRLYQSRARVKIANGDSKKQTDENVDTRAAVCADLRNTRPAMSAPSSRIAISKLIELFEPLSRLLDKIPVLLRLMLWLTSQSHPISCPSICFSASGNYLGGSLMDKLFRAHAANDDRINNLKSQVTTWLSNADLYIDFTRLRGRASVPLRTTNDIRTELRSTDVVITRLNPTRSDDEDNGRVARLTGADTSFTIPTCLLPSHAYLAPLPEFSSPSESEEGNSNDSVPISMSTRVNLPAHFSDSFLSFAATLSKTSQLADIEEEAGLATADTKCSVPRNHGQDPNSKSPEDGGEQQQQHHLHGFREKLVHGRVGAALRHPVQHGKQTLHKAVKKTVVDKVDGAWFAKWTNKALRQLEWLDGDVGYSMEVPVGLKR